MDEKGVHKSHKETVLKLLLPINAVFIILTLATALFIILNYLLPFLGITLSFNIHGNSMDPTIKGNALVAIDTSASFEELEIGDVILFKKQSEYQSATADFSVHVSKVPTDGASADDSSDSGSSDSASSSTPSDAETSDTAAPSDDSDTRSASGIGNRADEHTPYIDQDINYLDNYTVLHRIVAINTVADRALITKGDGNEDVDYSPVLKSGYIGKMLWKVDYIGGGIHLLYENLSILLVLTVAVSLITALLRRSIRSVR